MGFSIISFGKGGLELIDRLMSRKTWRDDLSRGLDALKTGGASLADRSIAEIELRQLRGHLHQIEEKLSSAYLALGKKSMDHWAGQQVLNQKGKDRAIRTLETLEKEKEKLIEQIAAHKRPANGNSRTESPPKAETDDPELTKGITQNGAETE